MSQSTAFGTDEHNELELIEFFIEEAQFDGSVYRGYYGMNVSKVLEIIRRPVVTNVPGNHHPAALGTFNLRGRVLPLVDLALWLGKKMVESESNKVIVCEFYGVAIAFLCSGVTRIHRLQWEQVEAPDRYVRAYSEESITGVLRLEGRILFILDMEKVITSMGAALDLDGMMGMDTLLAENAATDAESTTEWVTEADGSVVPKKIAAESAQHVLASGVGKERHILVVDDSSSIRGMIGSTLKQGGFSITTATSGRDAWGKLETFKAEVTAKNGQIEDILQLIISDIEMPEMDGHTLTKKIKADPMLQRLPVVLFSSLITDTMRIKGQAVGADDQISKPDLPGLTRRVCTLIEEKLGKV